jgi:hypothetical protein
MARVEEARRPAGRQGLPRHASPDAGHRVATVLEDRRDVLDVLRSLEPVSCRLCRLVGIERPLIVGVGSGVQLVAGQLAVEVLQLDAE